MKKNALFLFVLFVLTTSGLTIGNVGAFGPGSTPPSGDNPINEGGVDNTGYNVGDPCGYVMGAAEIRPTALANVTGTLDFTKVNGADVQTDADQACLDASGYFYKSVDRQSQAIYTVRTQQGVSTDYIINLAANNGTQYSVNVDQVSGAWIGHATFTDVNFPASTKRDVWFDWTCSGTAKPVACSDANLAQYHVKSMADGTIAGYAWNDYYGFISFNKSGNAVGVSFERKPRSVDLQFSMTTSDGLLPGAVTYANAPLADGVDAYQGKFQLFYSDTGIAVKRNEIAAISVTPIAAVNTILVNQVENSGGSAVTETSCGVSLQQSNSPCVTDENGGAVFTTNVTSRSPSSNMLGIPSTVGTGLEYLSDRAGCLQIYGGDVQGTCSGEVGLQKADVFYNRVNDRNVYVLNGLTVAVTFVDNKVSLKTGAVIGGNVASVAPNTYSYTLTTPESLSWRPRIQIGKLAVRWDDEDHDYIGAYNQAGMTLVSEATVIGAPAQFTVNYQLDVEGSTSNDDTVLITAATHCNRFTDTQSLSFTGPYKANLAIAYGQRDVACLGVAPGVGTSYVPINPTVEQYVCDGLSCYFTGALDRKEKHADAGLFMMRGAATAGIGGSSLTNDAYTSIFGNSDSNKKRNIMYAQVLRYTVGQTISHISSQHLDSDMDPGYMWTGMGGSLIVAKGDVKIDGSSDSFNSKTLVVLDGDVYIGGNIGTTAGTVGIIVFRGADGTGGNVYVDENVTDISAQIYADGAFMSHIYGADGVEFPRTATGELKFSSENERFSALKNQLYLKGSLSAHNTLDYLPDGDMGDGTTGDLSLAREHDLNMIRQYRLCYPTDAHGVPDETREPADCEEGALLAGSPEAVSLTADSFADNGWYPSFILDYAPDDGLPIFRTGTGGLFQ